MLTMTGNHIDSRFGELHQPQSCASKTIHVRERARRAMQNGGTRCDGLPTDGGITRDPIGGAAADADEEDELVAKTIGAAGASTERQRLVTGTHDLLGKHAANCAATGRAADTTTGTSSCFSFNTRCDTPACWVPNPSRSNAVAHSLLSSTSRMAMYTLSSNSATPTTPSSVRICMA